MARHQEAGYSPSTDNNISQLDKNANDDLQFSRKRIFTGSAASYDKPSLLYIGAGEGALAYGWLLYGSEGEGVARWDVEKEVLRKNLRVLFDGKHVF